MFKPIHLVSPFSSVNKIPLYQCTSLSIHSTVGRHFMCLGIGAIKNSLSLNMWSDGQFYGLLWNIYQVVKLLVQRCV